MIPYGRHEVTADDIDAVVDVLRSDHLTQGPVVPRFEQAVARHVGAAHAVAVNSATSALHIACLALDLGPGDLLWTSPITFVASANCARYCGADVDFVDIDPRTYNLCPEALERQLEAAARAGRLPKVVVPVHLSGQSCDMQAIHALGRRYGFRIIEDLVKWENTTNEEVLQRARDEIWQSWRYTCAANADHPRAKELFDRHKLPAFHDPFAGGGALPLQALLLFPEERLSQCQYPQHQYARPRPNCP